MGQGSGAKNTKIRVTRMAFYSAYENLDHNTQKLQKENIH